MADYCLYRGDQFLNVGSLDELSKFLGVSKKTVLFYMSPAYKKRGSYTSRLAVYKVED